MKTLKMNLENIQGKMNRKEMRNIMAGGSGSNCTIKCTCNGTDYGTVCSIQECWNKC
jgi:phosphotransferase system HPr-like phosphotransfer protein